MSKETDNIEITDNSENPINIFEGTPNSHLNNTSEKNENACVTPVKSSEPSEPSGDKRADTALAMDNGNSKAATTAKTTTERGK